MKRILFAVLFLGMAASVSAQLNNTVLENRIRPDSVKTGILAFDLYNFNFVRNYDFANAFQDANTLYGYQIEPQLVYYAHPNLVLSGGAYIRKDFGRKGFNDIQPLFSLKYSKDNVTLIAGSLEGNIHHRYIDPLYDFERKITDPLEYGTQLLIQNKKAFVDIWLSWRKMSNRAPNDSTQVYGGLSSDFTLMEKNGYKLSVPLQFMVFHKGKQTEPKNSSSSSTFINGAFGFKLSKKTDGFINEVFTENYLAVFRDLSNVYQTIYPDGNGTWLNAGVRTPAGTLAVSFWNGNRFVAPSGMPLFQSLSHQTNFPNYSEDNRQLLFFRYNYQRELIPNLYIDVRIEPYMDLHSDEAKKIEFSGSLFLTYKHQFDLVKTKK